MAQRRYHMHRFVSEESIIRKIWGKADTVLLIFAGAAAEFAANKAVDWLYFTGRLPADPLGRLFSTVTYAREIIFSSYDQATRSIDKMSAIHSGVEQARGIRIPDSAYRDVLFMLIYYSIAAFEALERKLTSDEKEEVVNVFCRVGQRMGIPGLPVNFPDWWIMYNNHIRNDLEYSKYTADLYEQYKAHLGIVRYTILIEAQKLLVTNHVRQVLRLGRPVFIRPLMTLYRLSRRVKADRLLKALLLPPLYKQRIKMLDVV
jgi:hypothetical protein